jgi:hypothetical protein
MLFMACARLMTELNTFMWHTVRAVIKNAMLLAYDYTYEFCQPWSPTAVFSLKLLNSVKVKTAADWEEFLEVTC